MRESSPTGQLAAWRERSLDEADIPNLLALKAEVFDNPREPTANWVWRYQENPSRAQHCRLAVDEHDPTRLAGHYAIVRQDLQIGPHTTPAAQSLDTLTHRDFRRQGIFVSLATSVFAEAKAAGVELVYGFPNRNSAPGFLNNLRFHVPTAMFHYVRPLSLRAGSRLRVPVPVPPQVLDAKYAAEYPSDIPNDWESLLHAAGPQFFACTFRSREQMTWRYLRCPLRAYALITLSLERSDGGPRGARRATVHRLQPPSRRADDARTPSRWLDRAEKRSSNRAHPARSRPFGALGPRLHTTDLGVHGVVAVLCVRGE